MRQSKAKRIDNGEWVYGCYIENSIDAPCIIDNDAEQFEVLPQTVCKYVTTKNGIDIYEDDLLKSEHYIFRVLFDDRTLEYRVTLGNIDEIVMSSALYILLKNDNVEKIGNAHDNKELIKL